VKVPFALQNGLNSFDFKLFFVYTLKLLRSPFGTLAHNFALFWKTYELLQGLLNVALEWFISFLTKQCENLLQNSQRGADGISEKGGAPGDRLP